MQPARELIEQAALDRMSNATIHNCRARMRIASRFGVAMRRDTEGLSRLRLSSLSPAVFR
jgi:hypothetical protein